MKHRREFMKGLCNKKGGRFIKRDIIKINRQSDIYFKDAALESNIINVYNQNIT